MVKVLYVWIIFKLNIDHVDKKSDMFVNDQYYVL